VTPLDTRFRDGFPDGLTPITVEGEAEGDTGIDLGIWRGKRDAWVSEAHTKETVWLLLEGKADLAWPGGSATISRASVFDEEPHALHLPPGARLDLSVTSEVAEFAVVRATNDGRFASRLYQPSDVAPEYRGKGLVQDAALRNVRTVFDYSTRPESSFVLGEVVNYPGRWSSYPPHHHEQPEIYHYRFSEPQGYGHSELGEQVLKVRSRDTVRILDGVSHAQVSAPGYAMYYIWIVRHLPGKPYKGFHYDPAHEWVLDPARQGWRPRGQA
jgi:5-deoxy-glucuronate isomerase